ncbi:MAG: hypothetical protein ACRBN8_19750 [Nannocystales bacterium]
MTKILPLLLTIAVGFAGCDQASCQAASAAAKPTLDAVLARADVPRLLECASLPTPKDAATCLGAEALTQGLEVALERATKLAEDARDAANPTAGAADMDAGQREVLAAELDAALDDLAREVAAANAA